jgi:hypothetical protein
VAPHLSVDELRQERQDAEQLKLALGFIENKTMHPKDLRFAEERVDKAG